MSLVRGLTLETSLKPFFDVSEAGITDTCCRLLTNWQRLIDGADCIKILLWVSEGNEVYEWRGDFEEELIWGNHVGFCNYGTERDMYDPDNRHYRIHQAEPYRNPDEMPYICFKHLKEIIACFKRLGQERYGKTVLVGATIDPGPEFAPSRFKVDLHPEVLTPDQRVKCPAMMHFMTHQATLNADDLCYAAFPNGIPDGCSFGTFLGKQFSKCVDDLGYDYIWFSNGFAYSHFPWGYRGEVFEGDKFDGGIAQRELTALSMFWTDFRGACPHAPIEVRGTNFTVGMDIATDACSHDEIHRIGKVFSPPCNPPWGSRALGLEMGSYLSRIAKPATDDILFRFYLNDPWFECNAWYDYYNKQPFDIFVPMSVARANADGSVSRPNNLAFLTVDTHKGELISEEADDVIPHIQTAFSQAADEMGPIIWVYPHDEYHNDLHDGAQNLAAPFFNDWYMCKAIDEGAPINSVMSSDVFMSLQEQRALPDALFVMPVPEKAWALSDALLTALKDSQTRCVLYGAMHKADPALHSALSMVLADGLDGHFDVEVKLAGDRFKQETRQPKNQDPMMESIGMYNHTKLEKIEPHERKLVHRSIASNGALHVERCASNAERVVLQQGDQQRVYASSQQLDSGAQVAWLRGTSHFDPSANVLEPMWDQPWQQIIGYAWLRSLIADFGWDIKQERVDESQRAANMAIHRHDNAFVFTGHKPNTTTRVWVKTPYGAPIYGHSETEIVAGYAGDCHGKTLHSEIRAFVEMEDGVVSYAELPIPMERERHICVSNLQNANLTIFINKDKCLNESFALSSLIKGEQNIEYTINHKQAAIEVSSYSGALYIMW